MGFCLPVKQANKVIAALKDGTIDPDKLSAMTSAQRRKFFTDLVGDTNAQRVNGMFEKTLLLKNQKSGMVTWAKNITGIKEAARRDIISKIGRMENVLEAKDMDSFLEDLASMRLGTDVTFEEARIITKLSSAVKKAKQAVGRTEPEDSKNRLAYGARFVTLDNYVKELQLKNTKTTVKSAIDKVKKTPGKAIQDSIIETAGFTKSMKASLDKSFWLRQGLKVLITHPSKWFKSFGKSLPEMFQQVFRGAKSDDIQNAAKASVWSRQKAIDGIYQKAGLDVGIDAEEAFPSSLPARLPGIGRFFKASETDFNVAAMRIRADVFDHEYDKAVKLGIDMTQKDELKSLGTLVNSMTGRGDIGRYSGKLVNAAFFSPRHLKSQIDFVTAHSFSSMTPYAKKVARRNLFKVSMAIASTMAIAYRLNPDSVEVDSRSADFGKIRVGNTRFDLTAGMSSLVTAMSRVATGEVKSSTTGRTRELNTGDFGSGTKGTVMASFLRNKLSPLAATLNDRYLRGTNFRGEKPTINESIDKLVKPIIWENVDELLDEPGAANVFIGTFLDALGISTNTY